jgi:hypothetical protein
MKRTLNWVYQARPCTDNLKLVEDQIYLAHRYGNKLREIERTRRDDALDYAATLYPDLIPLLKKYKQADAEINELIRQFRLRRQKIRKLIMKTEADDAAFKAAYRRRTAASSDMKEAKTIAFARMKQQRDEYFKTAEAEVDAQLLLEPLPENLGEKKAKELRLQRIWAIVNLRQHEDKTDGGAYAIEEAIKEARANCGVYWGTYLIIEDSLKDMRKGPPPKFKRYQGHGSIGVQIQGGMTVAEAIGGKDTQLRIDLEKCEAKIRVQSDAKKKPIWATFPFIYHRPLPSDAIIKYAYIDRERVGTKARWRFRLSIITSEHPQDPAPPNEKIVAVHMGHRLMDDGMRVLTWLGDDGEHGELMLDPWQLGGFEVKNKLQSVRDARYAKIQPMFVGWLKSLKKKPQWLVDDTETIGLWKDPKRLTNLIVKWRDNRFAADSKPLTIDIAEIRNWIALQSAQDPERKSQHWSHIVSRFSHPIDTDTMFGVMEYWRRWDKHLHEWQANQTKDAGVHRDQQYRLFTRELRKKYSKVVMADVDWQKLAKKEEEGEEQVLTPAQRANARIASPGRITELLVERFCKDAFFVDAKHITMKCHACGHINEWDHTILNHTCDGCGKTWDQDHNAVRNVLTSGQVAENRRAKRKAKKAGEETTTRKVRGNRRRAQQLVS